LRHPIYSAYLLAWIAAPLATGQFWLLLPAAAMGCLYYRAARQEENSFLTSSFAPRYKDYQERTGMFLPRIVRSLSRAPKALS
jgi:protein-S-isoprenylcysteine O-methyltransferase Ste14